MEQQTNVHRKMLAAATSSILIEYGFDTVENEVLGTLTEMLQACKFYIYLFLVFHSIYKIL